MDTEQIFVTLFALWVMGLVTAPMFDEFEHSFAEYIWWPLLLVKIALKGLWAVLFTEWRP